MKKIILQLVLAVMPIITAKAARVAQERPSSLETNVLWPFFPGGISEIRYLKPIVNSQSVNHGDLLLGLYSDFASKVVRDSKYGKVTLYALKLGYRQYFAQGWQAELAVNAGWREEKDRPGVEDHLIEGIAVRTWLMVGYQHDFSEMIYINTRAGIGVHSYRSDAYADTEKKLVPGVDVNVGIYF
jgi:hypothetical protein